MALIGASSFIPRKTTILPEGGRDFLHRRMMELVGAGVAAAGVVLLLALFTFSQGDPSLNHATGSAPHNMLGLAGAYLTRHDGSGPNPNQGYIRIALVEDVEKTQDALTRLLETLQ